LGDDDNNSVDKFLYVAYERYAGVLYKSGRNIVRKERRKKERKKK